MDELKRIQKSLEDTLRKVGEITKLKQVAEDMIPSETIKVLYNGKSVDASIGLTGKMICIVFNNAEDCKKEFEKLKGQK